MTEAETISMKHYIDTCIHAVEERIKSADRLATQRDELHALAIKKAEESMLARLEGMNEFRAQINSERVNYVTKEQMSNHTNTMNERLNNIKSELSNAKSFSAGKAIVLAGLVSLIPIALSVIALFR